MIDIQALYDDKEIARDVARIIADVIAEAPDAVIGLATGSSPIPTYRELVRLHKEEGLSFKNVRTFNLDEYLGLAPDHPQSYHVFMKEHLFDHVDIPEENTRILNGAADDPEAECAAFEQEIEEAGGIDLWLLGIGANGHIAFNEPGSDPGSRTRVVDIADETIRANSRFFETVDAVPRQALTAGIGTIMESRRILLIAAGPQKADAVRVAVEEDPSTECPASFLQDHPDCAFYLDAAAAEALEG